MFLKIKIVSPLQVPELMFVENCFLRMQKDFTCSISLLHAESEPYDGSPLVIATTHQLLKFYQNFDLVIVDEVDAFPFVGNVMLNHAVEQAKKETGRYIYLTATSTISLEEQVRLGTLESITLPDVPWKSFSTS